MKKFLSLLICLLGTLFVQAQTDGLNYQAVIIDPNPLELPGANATGNILPNTTVVLRFTISNSNGQTLYRETQETTTDAYGMVNVIIGQGVPSSARLFTEINWDGDRKDLSVAVGINGRFGDLGSQELTFIPYAYHRDIIASGDFELEGEAILDGDLTVNGITTLNNNLFVRNESPTQLTGTLDVLGITNFYDDVFVNDESDLSVTGALTVNGNTQLLSNLQVDGITLLNSTLSVLNNSPTFLTGSLTVDGVTNFNDDVFINNGSSLTLSGPLTVQGATTLEDDLTVNGVTNLNNELYVNNNSTSFLSGTLTVEGATQLENNLTVDGVTNLESIFNVNNQSPTQLSGSLQVDGETNLNSSLAVNNGSPTVLSGTLEVDGGIALNNNLTVQGDTNLNGALFVNNNAPTNLSGTLTTDGATILNNTLAVSGQTTLNDNLTVANASATTLTGQLDVTNETHLNNSLTVANGSPTQLTGTLEVFGASTLNDALTVSNTAPTNLTGTLNVIGVTTLENTLEVTNGSNTDLSGELNVQGPTALYSDLIVSNNSPTQLTGTLTVEGATALNNTVTVGGATTINNDLTVTGNTVLSSLNTQSLNIESDASDFVATFTNTNGGSGDGILIKLGKTHGAWNGSNYYNINNPIFSTISNPTIRTALSDALTVLRGRMDNPSPSPITLSEVLQLSPSAMKVGAMSNINNLIFSEINTRAISGSGDGNLRLPVSFPNLTVPSRNLIPFQPIFGGVTIPFVNITIPGWDIPDVTLPNIPIPTPSIPNPAQYIPSLPVNLPVSGLPNINLPAIPTSDVANSLTSENEFVTFQDKDGRTAGTIRAQSITDFRDNTILDNLYMMNVLSSFVGVDLLDGITAGAVEISNFIDEFNKIGVEYASGNGDYAEWLERIDTEEPISAGDIVGVIGGKITRDLTNAEQVMVVSHRPIIMGNAPADNQKHLGNNVAFMGQVPVKIIGPVNSGDYIVGLSAVKGYGKAISPKDMTVQDFKYTVGRSWETNTKEGPKTVLTVVGVHNGDWVGIVQQLKAKQDFYEAQFKTMESQLKSLEDQANQLLKNRP